MSERTKPDDGGMIEYGGTLGDWEPLKPQHRSETNPIQRVYKRRLAEILRDIRDRWRFIDVDDQSGESGTIET